MTKRFKVNKRVERGLPAKRKNSSTDHRTGGAREPAVRSGRHKWGEKFGIDNVYKR